MMREKLLEDDAEPYISLRQRGVRYVCLGVPLAVNAREDKASAHECTVQPELRAHRRDVKLTRDVSVDSLDGVGVAPIDVGIPAGARAADDAKAGAASLQVAPQLRALVQSDATKDVDRVALRDDGVE